MSLYTKDSLEGVKEAVDMVALVGAHTDLRRVGRRHTGLCPFHDERTPSFSVDAEQKLYHCFGCGASGDAIRFVQESESLDFKDAVEALAERYGVELRHEREDPRAEERRRRRDRLLGLLERAAAYYARFLWESAEARGARAYLEERGLGEEVLREFRVGYAPAAGDSVTRSAQSDGFGVEELTAAGLAQRGRRGEIQDRFRARVTFPLADPRGRVLGFGARAVGDAQQPKYLNSSENEVYHKGRQLFGIDHARGPAAKAGRVVAVEGYTDVLALHQAGAREVVATMGTALTPEQLAELSRVASTVFLAFDADRSGQEAMLRAARAAEERGVDLRVVGMPEGADPADLVAAKGIEAFRRLLDSACGVTEFAIRRSLADADLETPHGRDRALRTVLPLLEATPDNSATRDALVRHVADRVDVPAHYVVGQLAARGPFSGPGTASGSAGARAVPRTGRFEGASERTAPAPTPPARRVGVSASGPGRGRAAGASRVRATGGDGGNREESPTGPVERAERAFLAMCLAQGSLGREHLSRLSDRHLSSPLLRSLRDHLLEHFDDPAAAVRPEDSDLGAAVAEVVVRAETEPSSEPALRLNFLQLELRRVERDLKKAEADRDFERQRGLWPMREEFRREIDEVMGEAL